jgi:hypothetical protein
MGNVIVETRFHRVDDREGYATPEKDPAVPTCVLSKYGKC